MTASIPLSALPGDSQQSDRWRRDRWGRYLVRPKGEDKPTGYTRMTTVAKSLDNGGGLAPWKATLAVCGTIKRRSLRSKWEVLLAEHDGDPWYAGQESKKACKALVEECATASGADDRRETGTSLHALTALVDLGRPPTHLTAETERDLAAYRKALADAGITVAADLNGPMVERTVVLDDWRVAGTFDRGYIAPGFELPLIGDLKTGSDLSYSWQSIAVQLAGYSRGDAFYEQGPADDGSQDRRLPMPAFDQDHGLIVWLDSATGQCELFLVDIAAGWEAFQHSMFARGWRKAKVSRPLAEGRMYGQDEDLTPVLERSLELVTANQAQVEIGGETMTQAQYDAARFPLQSAAPGEVVETFTEALRAWLQERVNAIGRHPVARTDLTRDWPVGVAGLRAADDHTPEQLAAIERCLDAVERRNVLAFPPPRPEPADDLDLIQHVFPNTTDVTKES